MTVAVLAGGESRRMGRDKGEILIEGAPMLERVASAAAGAGLPVVVVGRERPEWWRLENVEFIDEPEHRGPLSGLEAALRYAGGDVILAACDMPRLTSAAFEWLAAMTGSSGDDGLITLNGDRPEPLFSFYRYSSLARVTDMLSSNRRAMFQLIEQGSFEKISVPAWLEGELHNVNRPEDLK